MGLAAVAGGPGLSGLPYTHQVAFIADELWLRQSGSDLFYTAARWRAFPIGVGSASTYLAFSVGPASLSGSFNPRLLPTAWTRVAWPYYQSKPVAWANGTDAKAAVYNVPLETFVLQHHSDQQGAGYAQTVQVPMPTSDESAKRALRTQGRLSWARRALRLLFSVSTAGDSEMSSSERRSSSGPSPRIITAGMPTDAGTPRSADRSARMSRSGFPGEVRPRDPLRVPRVGPNSERSELLPLF